MTDETPSPVNEPAFWQGLYERREDGWELAGPAPPLVDHLERIPPPRGRVAVLGCGRGHDCRLFAKAGYQVWGFDFAPEAIRVARALANLDSLEIVLEERDIFDLLPDYRGFFDGIWEYTCFCAIDPTRRNEYVRLVREILKPEGWLLACFYPLREGTDGPPFPTSEDQIRRLFAPHFAFVEAYAPRASVEKRTGLEWMVLARVKSEGAGAASTPP
ncbi:MAG: methyltransferase domain-containing protein [Candidatus Rokubacteria bacterium]|nr:methyltransferase domain-containing protein [Candidatus Rokubacteria bacterium]